MLKKKDLWWLLAAPIYLILSTFRHELAHAVAARAQGAEILKFIFWPSVYENGRFYFGYVVWRGQTTWLVDAAPYFFDILTFLLFMIPIFTIRFKQRWIWLNLVIIGMISPLINSAYNYLRGSDVRNLLEALPDTLVHGAFLLGLGLGLLVLVLALSRQADNHQENAS